MRKKGEAAKSVHVHYLSVRRKGYGARAFGGEDINLAVRHAVRARKGNLCRITKFVLFFIFTISPSISHKCDSVSIRFQRILLVKTVSVT